MKTILFAWITMLFSTCIVEGPEIGSGPSYGPPPWAPAYGYAQAHDYYYFPDWEIYYCEPTASWFYFDNGVWVTASVLPFWCADIDLYSSYKVVIDYRGNAPYLYHYKYKASYPPRNYHERGYNTKIRNKEYGGNKRTYSNAPRTGGYNVQKKYTQQKQGGRENGGHKEGMKGRKNK